MAQRNSNGNMTCTVRYTRIWFRVLDQESWRDHSEIRNLVMVTEPGRRLQAWLTKRIYDPAT